jgi:tetratricopeptide (TPR) repeat protein
MFAFRSYPRETRDTIWLAIMAMLGAAILLTMTVKLAGAADPQPTRLLPGLTAEWQEGVNQFRSENFAEARKRVENVQFRIGPWNRPGVPVDRGLALWNILTLQGRGEYEQAMREWAALELPEETLIWKHIALAAMHLERTEIDEAAEQLALAQLLEPENAVVHYYLGILHIQEADRAIDWPDYGQVATVRWVMHRPDVVPNTKGMYELAAIVDLERAVEAAGCLDRQSALIPEDWTTEPELRPTVEDVLLALAATGFEPNAHQMLGCLFLDQGALEVAEEHLDEAKKLGAQVPFIYDELGEEYEAAGRHADAARAYFKAVGNGPDRVGALMRFVQNVRDGFWEGL